MKWQRYFILTEKAISYIVMSWLDALFHTVWTIHSRCRRTVFVKLVFWSGVGVHFIPSVFHCINIFPSSTQCNVFLIVTLDLQLLWSFSCHVNASSQGYQYASDVWQTAKPILPLKTNTFCMPLSKLIPLKSHNKTKPIPRPCPLPMLHNTKKLHKKGWHSFSCSGVQNVRCFIRGKSWSITLKPGCNFNTELCTVCRLAE